MQYPWMEHDVLWEYLYTVRVINAKQIYGLCEYY